MADAGKPFTGDIIHAKDVTDELDKKVSTADVLLYGEIVDGRDLSGKVASASSVAYLRELQGIQLISLVPVTQYVELTDMVTLQGIVFVTGVIGRGFGTGVNKNIITLQSGLVIAQTFSAPISCYDGVVGEISGDSGSSYIRASISSIAGDGKFNFFFRVKNA